MNQRNMEPIWHAKNVSFPDKPLRIESFPPPNSATSYARQTVF